MSTQSMRPLEVFYSYVYQDSVLQEQLKKHLSGMKRVGKITWHDSYPGDDVVQEATTYLKRAHIVLLLVSPDFMCSDHHQYEIKLAMERHDRKEARVIPILLRPTNLQDTPFSTLHILPRDGRAVTKWDTIDDACVDIVQWIQIIVNDLSKPSPQGDPTLSKALQKLANGPSEQIDAVKRITEVLSKLSSSHKTVSELKRVHDMLHELKFALDVFPQKKNQQEILIHNIKLRWRIIKFRIERLQYFAEQEMEYLGNRLKEENGNREGPEWAIDALNFRDQFQGILNESDTMRAGDILEDFVSVCDQHLYCIDKKLLNAVEQIDRLSDQILKSMNYESTANI